MKQTLQHLLDSLPDDGGTFLSTAIGYTVVALYALVLLSVFLKARRVARLRHAMRDRLSVGDPIITRVSLIAAFSLLSACLPAPAAVCETNYGAESAVNGQRSWTQVGPSRALEGESLRALELTDTAPLDGMLRFYVQEIGRSPEHVLWLGLALTLVAIIALMMFVHVQGYNQGRRDEHFVGAGDRELARRMRENTPTEIFPPKPEPGVWISKPGQRGEE